MKRIFTPPDVTTEQVLALLRAAIKRNKASAHRHPSPLLGRMTIDEWNRLHCRHAELHLSFIVPQ